jgi:hypothetical protein
VDEEVGAAGGGAAAGAAALSPDGLAASDDAVESDDEAGLADAAAPLFEPLPRKSVTYQPEPLSWKPAAVTCLA